MAPSDLPGGYMFEAEIDQRRFLATVPAGGVRQGQTFSCIMRELDNTSEDIPIGTWKNTITDCFAHGILHPVVWNALFCPLLAIGQILTRTGFDFLGRPLNPKEPQPSAFNMMVSIVTFWFLLNAFIFAAFNYKWYKGLELSTADCYSIIIVNGMMVLFTVMSTWFARGAIREKFVIMGARYNLENCLCATFCLPCSICQMASHTAAFDEHGAACCTETGLPPEMDQVLTTVGSSDGVPPSSPRGDSYLV
jgi:Cys-rich protein (TIGR01571 family)